MATYLAPIDEGLLDVAVGQWFRKVYSNRFEELAEDGKLEAHRFVCVDTQDDTRGAAMKTALKLVWLGCW